MSKNVGEVRASGGDNSGIWVALPGVAGPTSNISTLAEGWVDGGYMEGGYKDTSTFSETEKRGYPGNALLRSNVTEYTAQFETSLAQRSEHNMILGYGIAPVGGVFAVTPGASVNRQIIFQSQDGDDEERIWVPDAIVRRNGDISYNDEDLVVIPILIKGRKTTITINGATLTAPYFIIREDGTVTTPPATT